MAYEIPGFKLTLPAAADLSAEQFTAMVVDANGRAAQAGAGVRIAGVLQNKPSAIDQAAELMVSGVTKGVAGGACTAGQPAMTDANGEFLNGTATNVGVGIFLSDAVAGDIVSVLLKDLETLA